MVNYTSGSAEVRKAWFEYKKAHPYDRSLRVVDFVAGWNACRHNTYSAIPHDARKSCPHCSAGVLDVEKYYAEE